MTLTALPQLAHGLGGRSDLPVPLPLALLAAATAVIASFLALSASSFEPEARGPAGRPLPPWLQRVLEATPARALLRGAVLLLFAVAVVAAAFGGRTAGTNPVPTWLFVWLWVGLLVSSLLLGPVWRVLNPLRTISRAIGAASGADPDAPPRAYPRALGYWPAAASLAVFVWVELVLPNPGDPLVVIAFIGAYTIVHIGGANVFGLRWYERADGFEVYSSLVARLAPLGRRADGVLVLRSPLRGLARRGEDPGLLAVVCVLLGSTAFDGIARTTWWTRASDAVSGAADLALGTAGLCACVAFVAITFAAALSVAERLGARPTGGAPLRTLFLPSLVPIAVGYTVAHYFSLLLFQGQLGYILASDPLALGWNLFGTAEWAIDYFVLSPGAVALVQVGAIVAGHIAGVVAAHDRAVEVFPSGLQRRGEYPLLAVMVLYTVGGIALLVGT
ncbi:MAG TPA: hypothetical protein VHK89_01635 [Actinomycetota bacterium]|nr:hypothetical protein [Actinomycetota bacterium]